MIAIQAQLLHALEKQRQTAADVKAELNRLTRQRDSSRRQLNKKIEPLRRRSTGWSAPTFRLICRSVCRQRGQTRQRAASAGRRSRATRPHRAPGRPGIPDQAPPGDSRRQQRPAGVGSLVDATRQPVDGARDGQSHLAIPFRQGTGRHSLQLRHPRHTAPHPELLDWLASAIRRKAAGRSRPCIA